MRCSYRVHREDGNDLVPLGALIWPEIQLFRQPSCKVVDALSDLQARVCLAAKTAREGCMRVAKRVSAIMLIQHEITHGNRVWWVKWELRDP
jgi:hypothetical protein